jgi:hypothetical protein
MSRSPGRRLRRADDLRALPELADQRKKKDTKNAPERLFMGTPFYSSPPAGYLAWSITR